MSEQTITRNERDPQMQQALEAVVEEARKKLAELGVPTWKAGIVVFNPTNPRREYMIVGSKSHESAWAEIESALEEFPCVYRGVAEDSVKTPILRKWARAVAEDKQGALILVRLGDFYEMFGDDAKAAAPVLNVALTKRGGIPMCGVAYHTIEKAHFALTDAGFEVEVHE